MLAATDHQRDVYEDFEPSKDTLYFRIGRGKVSFHGPNYHIAKQLSQMEKETLIRNAAFVRLSSNCYVNVSKITSLDGDRIRFEDHASGAKYMEVPLWRKLTLQHRLQERSASEKQ